MKPRYSRALAQPRHILAARLRSGRRAPVPAPCKVLDPISLRVIGLFDPTLRRLARLTRQRGVEPVRDAEGRV